MKALAHPSLGPGRSAHCWKSQAPIVLGELFQTCLRSPQGLLGET